MFNLPDKLTGLFTPPVFEDKKKTRIAGRINIILLCGVGLVAAAGIVNVFTFPRPFPQFIAACAFLAWLLFHLLLLRKGYIRLVRLLFPITAWPMITLLVLFSGGINSPNIAGYIALILGVGLIFGIRPAIGVTVLTAATILIILPVQARNLLPDQLLVYRPINVWAVYILWFTLAAVLLYVGTSELWGALRTSQSRLRSLLDTMSDGVVLINPDSQIVQTNPAAERILGRKRSEIEGLSYVSPEWEILRPDGTPMPPEEMAAHRAMKEKRPVNDVMMGVRRPDGSICWININAAPIMDAAGQLEAVVGTFADITARKQAEFTERKRAEEAVRESEEYYRELVEKAGIAVVIDDQEGNFDYFNDEFVKIFGYSPDEIKQHFIRSLVHPDDVEMVVRYHQARMQGKEAPTRYEFRGIKKDGTTVFLEVDVVCLRKGKSVIGTRSYFWDITARQQAEEAFAMERERLSTIPRGIGDGVIATDIDRQAVLINHAAETLTGRSQEEALQAEFAERKRAEEAVRESEEHYRELVEKAGIATVIDDQEGNFDYFNDEFVKIFGYSPDEIKQHFIRSLVHPDDVEMVVRYHQARMQGKEAPTRYEFRGIKKDGTTVFLEVHVVCLRKGKSVIGTRSYFWDITERKRVEEALRESEEKYHAIFEQAAESIVLVDTVTGELLEFNNRAHENLGYTREEFKQLKIPDIEVIESAEEAAKHLEKIIKVGIDTFETKHRTKGGEIRHVEVRSRALSIHGRKLTLGIWRDITEYKRAEVALRESEEHYRELSDSITDIFFAFDKDLKYTYWNKASEELTGISAKDAVGKSLYELFPDTPQTRSAERVYLDVLRTQQPQSFVNEYQIGGKDFFFDISAYPSKDGISVFTKDITERKRVEEALAMEQERLSTTLRGIVDGVITTDIDLQVVLINQAAETLTGWSQEEALGRPLAEVLTLVDETSGTAIDLPTIEILKDQVVVLPGQRVTLISRSDRRIPVSLSISPLKDRESQVIGMVMVIRDVTERERLESEMLRSAKLESLGVLAGGLAHDFNNFLMSIMLNLSTARLYLRDDPKAAGMLKDAEESTRRARGITQQLATFSRGGVPVTASRYLTPMLKEAVKFSLHGSPVRARFKLEKELWPVEIDPGQINQVLNNLAINAVQAMPEGGTLTVTTANVTVDEEHPRGPLSQGQYVEVALKDKGTGIPPESLDKIFDPYFTTKEMGSGLGLFSVYSIINKHNGWITVDSEVNKGTTFTFYLPAAAAAIVPPYSKEREAMSRIISGRGRILVMDDDELIRKALGRLLDDFGFEAAYAPDGAAALELFKQAHSTGKPFRAAILDFTIPGGMGGVETLERMREVDPEVKLIVTSGYANAPIMAHYEDYGFQGRLAKPFTAAELSEVLREVLGEK